MMRTLPLIIAWLLVYACANVGNPTGGPRDESPPKLLRSIPENGTVNFQVPFITLVFDEFIQLKDPQKNIVVSPQLPIPIEYEAKRKTLYLTLPDSLAPNTTYTINFGTSVVDLNEANPIPNLIYVFSTGPVLDSLTLSGTVNDYRTGKPVPSVTVALYDHLKDTVVTRGRPFYMRKTGDQGNFTFEYLKADTFLLAAFSDVNGNLAYDVGTESVGFTDKYVILPTDSSIHLLITKPYASKQQITSLKRVNQSLITGTLAKPMEADDTLVFSLPGHYLFLSTTRDSFSLWLDSVSTKNLDAFLLRGVDTISKRTVFGTTPQSVQSFYKRTPALRNTNPGALKPNHIKLMSDAPIQSSAVSQLMISKDSVIVEDSLYSISSDSLFVYIHIKNSDQDRYTLSISPNFITDIYGRKNDSLKLTSELIGPEGYGSIVLNCLTPAPNPYILSIQSLENKNTYYSFVFHNDTSFIISHILPGTYQIDAYIDTDLNGYWSPGSYPDKFPEVYYRHPEKLTVRTNWELVVDVILPADRNDH